LVSTDRSLLTQSHVPGQEEQGDGWGVAWYAKTRNPRIEKGVQGAWEESERFHAAAHRAHGPVVIAHLRKASNPMNLSHARLIGLENSQPYSHGGYLFAHNGSIPLPRETRARLGALESKVRGVNDSEVLFWLLVKHTEALGDPLRGFAATVEELTQVWEEKGRATPEPFTGLNVLFTRGPNELWAFDLWKGDHGSALMDAQRPYYALAYAADAKQIIVGSEPFDGTRPDWKSLGNGEFLHARADLGLVAVETGKIPLPPMAVRPTAG
jgi:predicted glutamine amidotransferase